MAEDFQQVVRTHFGGRCGNCGGNHKCRARLVIPVDLGGQETVSNSVYLCRSCELNAAVPKAAGADQQSKRLVNVWISQRLHASILGSVEAQGASRLARALVAMYLDGPVSRFDDLMFYQDAAAETRLYVWLDGATYDAFKGRVTAQGMSVTAAVIGLFRLYQAETGASGA